MKKILSTIIALFFFTSFSFAQSANDKIGEMMNNGQWFELREYLQTENDSVSPFIEKFANAMLAHFFNQPELAVENSQALIKDFSEDLGIGNILSVGQIIAEKPKQTWREHTSCTYFKPNFRFYQTIS